MDKFNGLFVSIALIMLGAFSLSTSALATPIADGMFDPLEGYNSQYSVSFGVAAKNVKGGTTFEGTTYSKGDEITVGGGSLYLYNDADSNDLYGALILPLSLVDNTYGDNSVGWGKDAAPSEKNHNLKDLTGSDDAKFTITDQGGNAALDFLLDYGLTGGSTSNDNVTYGTSLAYNFSNFDSVSSSLFGGKKPSSPDTNYSGGTVDYSKPADAYTTTNPALSDWVYDVIYEFKVDGSAFNNNFVFGGLQVGEVHISPNKIGENATYGNPPVPVTPGAAVPEPASVLLLGGGLAALAGMRWRDKLKAKLGHTKKSYENWLLARNSTSPPCRFK